MVKEFDKDVNAITYVDKVMMDPRLQGEAEKLAMRMTHMQVSGFNFELPTMRSDLRMHGERLAKQIDNVAAHIQTMMTEPRLQGEADGPRQATRFAQLMETLYADANIQRHARRITRRVQGKATLKATLTADVDPVSHMQARMTDPRVHGEAERVCDANCVRGNLHALLVTLRWPRRSLQGGRYSGACDVCSAGHLLCCSGCRCDERFAEMVFPWQATWLNRTPRVVQQLACVWVAVLV